MVILLAVFPIRVTLRAIIHKEDAMKLPNFIKRALNKVTNFFVKPPAPLKIPAPYTNCYDASKGFMSKYADAFNAIAKRHPAGMQGCGIWWDKKTGEPYAGIILREGYKGDLSDIPVEFGNDLPVRVEFRPVAKLA
jgi:hypothetical protein